MDLLLDSVDNLIQETNKELALENNSLVTTYISNISSKFLNNNLYAYLKDFDNIIQKSIFFHLFESKSIFNSLALFKIALAIGCVEFCSTLAAILINSSFKVS